MVQFVLKWVDGGEQARELLSITDANGAYVAAGGICSGISVIALNNYRKYRSSQSSNILENQ